MEIKFDFWVTPDGYTGDGHPSIGRAYHVKGSTEVPDVPVIAIMAAVLSEPDDSLSDAYAKASALFDCVNGFESDQEESTSG